MKNNKQSVQNRIRNISSEKNVPSNVILQEYFFEAFIKRLSKSKYVDNFVFKGGFLLSADLGIEFRSTMDMDFLLRNMAFSMSNIKTIVEEITKIEINDNITFKFRDIEEIRKDDRYGGYTISLLGILENIKVVVNIDIATGDPITPSAEFMNYKSIFDDECFKFASYNYETVLAEKIQTILRLGTLNSRSKDFYDIYIIYKLRLNEIDFQKLKKAFAATCNYRGTIFSKNDAYNILDTIKESKIMSDRWTRYSKHNEFTNGISYQETVDILFEFMKFMY